AVIELQTEQGTYTLPANQINLQAIKAQWGEEADLADIRISIAIKAPSQGMTQDVENAASNGAFSIIGLPVEFTVQYQLGSVTGELTSFSAYVSRTIPIPAGVDPSKVTTAIVVDADGTVRHVPTQIIEVN